MKKLMALLAAAALAFGLVACGGDASSGSTPAGSSGSTPAGSSSTATPAGEGKVYFLNFKPEQDEAYQNIAKAYTEKTGVPVSVVTAASGTYEQTLKTEMAKSDPPTIFQINGPVGYQSWKDYCADLSGTELYSHLVEGTGVVGDGTAVYGIPFTVEGYGIIVNKAIMQQYFDMDGAKAASLDEINSFAKLKEVVEDMQAQKDALGINGVFASTSFAPGQDWRWQTHLANIALSPEFSELNADMSDPKTAPEITFKYNENYKNLFDLYLNNSTIAPQLVGGKGVSDSMAEFALGEAAMVQNGNWGYSEIAGVEGTVVTADDVAFIPMYMGLENEASQGIAIGTENFFCINAKANEADQQASIDFFTWLYTDPEAKDYVKNDLGFLAPFDTFTAEDAPADPLGKSLVEWQNKSGVTNVPWDFTIFPSQQFKDNFGSNLRQYAEGSMPWEDVVSATVADWKTEKELIP